MAITKGMILCAGLGTRLLPITKRLPKPLIPVLNLPNVLHIAALMEQAGIKDIIVNTFHLANEVESFLSKVNYKGIRFSFSHEKEALLGTGGGVKKAQHFFGDDSFVLANCDFVTNIALAPFIEKHLSRKALATMVLFEDESRQHLYSRVGVTAESHLCSLPKYQSQMPAKGGIFTGIHVLSPEIFSFLEEKPCGINDILYPVLMKKFPNKVFGEFARNSYWYDTGDFATFLETTKKLLDLRIFPYSDSYPGAKITPPVMIGEGCSIGEGSKIGPYAVIGKQAKIGRNVQVSSAIVLDGATVSDGSNLNHVMHWETQSLPAKS